MRKFLFTLMMAIATGTVVGQNGLSEQVWGGQLLQNVKAVDLNVGWIAGKYGGPVLRTLDGGTTWQTVTSPLVTGNISGLEALDSNTAMVTSAPDLDGNTKSTNGGKNWVSEYSWSLSGYLTMIDSVQVGGALRWWAATAAGPIVTYCKVPSAVGELDVHHGAEVYALHQNYPNPFNPVTTIRYIVGTHERAPGDSWVKLAVYISWNAKWRYLLTNSNCPGSTQRSSMDGDSGVACTSTGWMSTLPAKPPTKISRALRKGIH